MLGLDTSWYIGSPATARPLANEPFAPPKRRRRLVRGCKFGFPDLPPSRRRRIVRAPQPTAPRRLPQHSQTDGQGPAERPAAARRSRSE